MADIGAPPSDAGEGEDATHDATVPPYDAAVMADAGAPPSDAGEGEDATHDATVPPYDAGVMADAGPAPPDAGEDAAHDATVPPSDAAVVPDVATPSCGGQLVFGLYWVLSATSQNCDQACAGRGGYDPRANAYVGTAQQGGSLDECTQVLRALGFNGTVGKGKRQDGNGFGCHVWSDGSLWWLEEPNFNPSIQALNWPGRMACACAR
jgi:hypothetical protein